MGLLHSIPRDLNSMYMLAMVGIGPLNQADNDARFDIVLSNEFDTKSTNEALQCHIN